MNNVQVSKTQFATSFAGKALLQPLTTVTFNYSGTITGGQRIDTQFVPLLTTNKYTSDAIYQISGSQVEGSYMWFKQPRNIYLIPEPTLPLPRIYLYKENTPTGVIIYAQITNNTTSNFTLTGTYSLTVDVFVFGSNLNY